MAAFMKQVLPKLRNPHTPDESNVRMNNNSEVHVKYMVF